MQKQTLQLLQCKCSDAYDVQICSNSKTTTATVAELKCKCKSSKPTNYDNISNHHIHQLRQMTTSLVHFLGSSLNTRLKISRLLYKLLILNLSLSKCAESLA